ncbi:rod shape-determining protein MreC [Patescibacteria group bacterium]|nr:rod shape-determining protein MreC [Patescibacteria group bacterium]MBU1721980.1 rod shape-determining protein MreC [Patescibacteria group bacterium]MBU1901271.1 rod shape-determining protein MreC [Patescibacteria group bacterium]
MYLERKYVKTMLSVAVVIAIVIITHILGWLLPIEQFFRHIINPSSQTIYQWSITLNEETDQFDSVEELEDAYIKLKQTVIDNEVDQARILFLEQEHEEFERQLQFFRTSTYAHVGAMVIGKNIESLSNSIILNKGTADGVNQGNAVIVGDGILVGTVIRTDETTSIVRLINDSQSKIAAMTLNNDHSIGLIEGGYDISVRMNFIPQHEYIAIGDQIVTSGLEDNIPRGLYIGTIESIKKEAYKPFQEALVNPPVHLGKIAMVSILVGEAIE